jgi:hypothetical protein
MAMSIWRRWFGKIDQEETTYDDKQDEGQLKTELRHLQQQRLSVEQRGCFSDRELTAKDFELEEIDRRINAVKKQQFRLHTRAKLNL